MFVSRTNVAGLAPDKAVDRASASIGVSRLAVDVVARLAARDSRADVFGDAVPDAGFVEALMAAARGTGPLTHAALKPDMRRLRVGTTALADVYIPHVARALGRAWEEDLLSFAGVTMAVARLQALLRDISAEWGADDCAAGGFGSGRGKMVLAGDGAQRAATVLVVVPGEEQHTLGAMVLTSQLRRMGVSVCLQLQPRSGTITALLRNRRFDGAIVSVGGQGKLQDAETMLKMLKSLTDGQMRVAVGGAAVEKIKTIGLVAGADILTNDLDAALGALGVRLGANCVDDLRR